MIELYDLIDWLKRNLSITEEIETVIIVRDKDNKNEFGGFTKVIFYNNGKEIIRVTLFLDHDTTLPLLHEICIHEFIHVSQIIRGCLDTTTNSTTTWRGKDYSEYSYKMLPWELEAHRYSKELLDLYNKGEDLSPEKQEEMIKYADKIYKKIEYMQEQHKITQSKLPEGINLKPFMKG